MSMNYILGEVAKALELGEITSADADQLISDIHAVYGSSDIRDIAATMVIENFRVNSAEIPLNPYAPDMSGFEVAE